MSIFPVVSLAMQHVNANNSVLQNYVLDMDMQDGQCVASVVMHKFINVVAGRNYEVIMQPISISSL